MAASRASRDVRESWGGGGFLFWVARQRTRVRARACAQDRAKPRQSCAASHCVERVSQRTTKRARARVLHSHNLDERGGHSVSMDAAAPTIVQVGFVAPLLPGRRSFGALCARARTRVAQIAQTMAVERLECSRAHRIVWRRRRACVKANSRRAYHPHSRKLSTPTVAVQRHAARKRRLALSAARQTVQISLDEAEMRASERGLARSRKSPPEILPASTSAARRRVRGVDERSYAGVFELWRRPRAVSVRASVEAKPAN